MPSFWLILSPALGIQAGWCLLPASCMLLCGWVGQRRVSALHRPGQLVWCLSLGNLNENVIETASNLVGSQWRTSPFRTSQKGGMGWSKEAQITKMFFLALVALVLMSKNSCWLGYSWLKPPGDCLTDVLFLWYQMQAFDFWLMCTSLLIYFYQVFSTPDIAAGDFPRRHLLLLPLLLARRARSSLTPGSCRALLHGLPATAS